MKWSLCQFLGVQFFFRLILLGPNFYISEMMLSIFLSGGGLQVCTSLTSQPSLRGANNN